MDIDPSVSEKFFGTTLRLPGEFFATEDEEFGRLFFLVEFCKYMQSIKPIPNFHRCKLQPILFKSLDTSSHSLYSQQADESVT